jgi:SAM-dependent methyltransferase
MTPQDAIELNRNAWNAMVPFHLRSDFYDVESFKAGRNTLTPIEQALLPDVAGRSLLHLQCHFGLDTLSWARKGAIVTGLDISRPAIEAARALAREIGVDARFVESEVYAAPRVLPGEQFDIVFTSLGALLWMPDIFRWARVAAQMTRPGATPVAVDLHPLIYVFPDIDAAPDLRVTNDYFGREPKVLTEAGSYASDEAPETTTVEYPHTMADILNAVLQAGFAIERFDEHPEYMCAAWPWMVPDAEFPKTLWRLPAHVPRVPLMFSLKARRRDTDRGSRITDHG